MRIKNHVVPITIIDLQVPISIHQDFQIKSFFTFRSKQITKHKFSHGCKGTCKNSKYIKKFLGNLLLLPYHQHSLHALRFDDFEKWQNFSDAVFTVTVSNSMFVCTDKLLWVMSRCSQFNEFLISPNLPPARVSYLPFFQQLNLSLTTIFYTKILPT